MRRISQVDAKKAFLKSIKAVIGFAPQGKETNVLKVTREKALVKVNDRHYIFDYEVALTTSNFHEAVDTEIEGLLAEAEDVDEGEDDPEDTDEEK